MPSAGALLNDFYITPHDPKCEMEGFNSCCVLLSVPFAPYPVSNTCEIESMFVSVEIQSIFFFYITYPSVIIRTLE